MNTCEVDETKKPELIPADILKPTRNKVGANLLPTPPQKKYKRRANRFFKK
jgi:hypothetical protein